MAYEIPKIPLTAKTLNLKGFKEKQKQTCKLKHICICVLHVLSFVHVYVNVVLSNILSAYKPITNNLYGPSETLTR